PWNKKFFEEAVPRLKAVDPSATVPDRYVQSNFEAMNALKLGMEKSGFQGRDDTPKLIAALEGLEMKEGDDFPQGDKTLRKEDHQAFIREFIYEIHDGKYRIVEVVPKEKTMFPPACKFPSALSAGIYDAPSERTLSDRRTFRRRARPRRSCPACASPA